MIILNLVASKDIFVCLAGEGGVQLLFYCDYLLSDIIRLSKIILR